MKIIENRNKELAAEALRALKANQFYCPCALEQNDDTHCMCKDFKDKVKDGYKGECNCGLYESI